KGSDNSSEDTECSPTRVTETAPEAATVVSLPSEQAHSSSTMAQMRDLEGMWHLESRGECPAQPGRMFPVGPVSISPPPRPSCQESASGTTRRPCYGAVLTSNVPLTWMLPAPPTRLRVPVKLPASRFGVTEVIVMVPTSLAVPP